MPPLQVREGVWEPWCDFELRVDAARSPEKVEVVGDDGARVMGQRYRLVQLQAVHTRPLPATGKVVVRHAGAAAEALLSLPAPAVRSGAQEGPSGLWLTVGLLAADGLALQLRLTRADVVRVGSRQCTA